MTHEFVIAFNNQSFTKGCAFLRIKCYHPEDIKLQNIRVKKKVRKIEVIRLRNGNKAHTLLVLTFKELLKMVGKLSRFMNE